MLVLCKSKIMRKLPFKLIGLCFFMLFTYNLNAQKRTAKEAPTFKEVLWEVKAIRSTSDYIKIKAIDEKGREFDVKAIQTSEETNILDVKAFVRGKRLPVKILVSDDKYHPVKAIDDKGKIYNVKAVTKDGLILPVKGVSQSGNIVHIRAIFEDMIFYDIVAIAPDGKVNDVKGIKMSQDKVETTVYGVEVFAHIKSIKQ